MKADLYDRDNPDWIPTVNMGPKDFSSPTACDRYQRHLDRNKKNDAARTLIAMSKTVQQKEDCDTEHEGHFHSVTCQTDLTCQMIEATQNEISFLQTSNESLKTSREPLFSKDSMTGNDEKVKHFTGFPQFTVLMALLDFLEPYMPAKLSLCKFESLMLALVKLRMNLSNQFLSYLFNLSQANVSRTFTEVVDVMYVCMKPLVLWLDRETIRMTMTMQFRKHFSLRCAAIIDCFEVFIDRAWSNYKHHNRVKFLLGITPQGVISFISRSWGGRASDKHITENCGFLNLILPGDLILADRGFDTDATLGSLCAEVKMSAFTQGKSQLSPLDLETTKKLAHVRINVERVIGLVRQKFTVLSSTLPIDMLNTRFEEDIPTTDKVAHICCGLTNMCESVFVFE